MRTFKGKYWNKEITMVLKQPVHELVSSAGPHSWDGALPGREWSNAAAEAHDRARVFADKVEPLSALWSPMMLRPGAVDEEEVPQTPRQVFGVIRLPECAPIAVSRTRGEVHYVVDMNGWDRFDEAVLAAMALGQGMNINDVGRFVRFTRAILKAEQEPSLQPERI